MPYAVTEMPATPYTRLRLLLRLIGKDVAAHPQHIAMVRPFQTALQMSDACVSTTQRFSRVAARVCHLYGFLVTAGVSWIDRALRRDGATEGRK